MRRESHSKRSLRDGGPTNRAVDSDLRPAPLSSEQPGFETAAFLAAIVQSSDDAIVSKDLNSIITSWNRGAERIFGYRAAEVIGRPITILIPPEHIDEETRILEHIRRGERMEHFETVRLRKDGSAVDVSLTVSPIRDAEGRIIGASKIARDISERLRARERLRQSEERFHVTLSSIGDGVIATDKAGCVTFMNPVAEQLTGYTCREAIGVPLSDVFIILNEITREPVRNPVERVIEKGSVVGLGNHTVLISKDGREQPIDDSAAPIRARDGELTGVVLVFRDATKQRAAEMTARRLAAIIENSGEAIYSADLNGLITSWNPAAERIFGYTAAEIIGRPNMMIIPRDQADQERQIVERLHRGEKVVYCETVRLRKGGSPVDVALTISLLKEPSSEEVIGVSKIARDITRRKQREADLRKAHAELQGHARTLETMVTERTAKLQQTIADLEAFSFTISHDLRSPLRSMEGFARALLEDYTDKLDAHGRNYLERIANSAVRLDRLILDVLTYSRLGQKELVLLPVDLDNLMDEVIQTYPPIRDAGDGITVEHPLGNVAGNHIALVQCVSNLLDNAVKFVAPGTKPQIRVRTEKRDSKVRCYIEDHGIGISQNLLSKIFEPFQRGHPGKDYDGTGMGLAIVRKALDRMGGSVGVQSNNGQGSTFWFELPAAA